jgi:hypothetical protein
MIIGYSGSHGGLYFLIPASKVYIEYGSMTLGMALLGLDASDSINHGDEYSGYLWR